MFRRIVVLAALFAFAVPLARASEQTHAPRFEELRQSLERIAPRLELTRLFTSLAGDDASYVTEDGVAVPATTMEVLVARIGTDGKPLLGCVDGESAAHRFLNAPIERVQNRDAQDH